MTEAKPDLSAMEIPASVLGRRPEDPTWQHCILASEVTVEGSQWISTWTLTEPTGVITTLGTEVLDGSTRKVSVAMRILQELGREGWEVVTVVTGSAAFTRDGPLDADGNKTGTYTTAIPMATSWVLKRPAR